MKKLTTKKNFTSILSLLFICTFLLSMLFLIVHRSHKCMDDDCVVCCLLETGLKNVRGIHGVNGLFSFLAITLILGLGYLVVCLDLSPRPSPIGMKIRMNN